MKSIFNQRESIPPHVIANGTVGDVLDRIDFFVEKLFFNQHINEVKNARNKDFILPSTHCVYFIVVLILTMKILASLCLYKLAY